MRFADFVVALHSCSSYLFKIAFSWSGEAASSLLVALVR